MQHQRQPSHPAPAAAARNGASTAPGKAAYAAAYGLEPQRPNVPYERAQGGVVTTFDDTMEVLPEQYTETMHYVNIASVPKSLWITLLFLGAGEVACLILSAIILSKV
jgi:hypothetical protein